MNRSTYSQPLSATTEVREKAGNSNSGHQTLRAFAGAAFGREIATAAGVGQKPGNLSMPVLGNIELNVLVGFALGGTSMAVPQ